MKPTKVELVELPVKIIMNNGQVLNYNKLSDCIDFIEHNKLQGPYYGRKKDHFYIVYKQPKKQFRPKNRIYVFHK